MSESCTVEILWSGHVHARPPVRRPLFAFERTSARSPLTMSSSYAFVAGLEALRDAPAPPADAPAEAGGTGAARVVVGSRADVTVGD